MVRWWLTLALSGTAVHLAPTTAALARHKYGHTLSRPGPLLVLRAPPPNAINGKPGLAIDLHGRLAAILGLVAKTGKTLENSEFPVESVELVAGAGFEPATFRL